MTSGHQRAVDSRIQDALAELRGMITAGFPDATFEIEDGEDPEGVYLIATVDVDDRQEVIDLFIDRLVTMQVDEALPVYVLPVRTPERNAALLQRQRDRIPADVSAALQSLEPA